jgi:hypothetical protein
MTQLDLLWGKSRLGVSWWKMTPRSRSPVLFFSASTDQCFADPNLFFLENALGLSILSNTPQ